ncbi:MAG: hypothetical protein K0U52_06690, partial [Gammaproteobacteria bacterium]|nr:hypothetical protein [Gammaproteobacteria bacterium]
MIEQIAHLWMAGKAHVTALGTQAAELPARARNALPAREEITGYWQQAIQVRQGIALPLELLHDNVQLSLTVKELREALLDSIIKPSSTALSKRKKEEQAAKAGEKPKAIDGTIDSATTLDQHEESKKEIQENIHYAVRTISNALETHTWSRHITAAFLVSVNEDGFFVEAADDSFQVLQIKKLLNVLYHFELGLESIESEDLKPVLQYLVDLPDNLDERTWKDLLTSDLWNIGKYLLIAADRSAWWQLRSFRNTAADNAKRRVLDAVDHIYSACDLLTHIEPEFFGAFGAEWGWVKDKLASTGVMKQIEPIKDVIAEQSKVDLFKKDLFKKGAFLQGVLLDQLRPNETGGADYSLLFQLLTVFGQEANKKAGKLGRAFLDSDTDAELESKDLLAKLKSWVVEHVAEAKTVKEFEDLVTKEIDERPEEEKQRLKELNRTATRLSRAFARVNGENVFISLDVMHYASIAWYGLNLLSAITKEAKSLNEDSQKAIQKVIIAFRDEYVAQLVGLVDKAEEVSLSTPGALTKPLIAQLEGYYQQMVKNSTFVDLSDLGGLQSEKFTAKRLEMAQKRRAEHVEQLHHVGDVLLQALATLTNPNPSELEKEKMISLYAVLQPHIEAIDMLFSKELIENLQNHSVQYPVISPNNHALLSPLSARLKHLKHTKELAVALTDDL